MTLENLFLPGLVAASLFALPSPLRAQDRREGGHTQVALEFEYAGPIDQGDVTTGAGGAIRLGSQADLLLLSLPAEIGGSYHRFGGVPDVTVYRRFLGGRISVDDAPSFDPGLFLDLTVLPLVDLGIHARYVTLPWNDDLDAFDNDVEGAHAALVF